MSTALRFGPSDFEPALPVEGFYPSEIGSVRFRRSARGNQTLQVVFHLLGVEPGADRASEYFVLEGESPRACAVARQRLLRLYGACGRSPASGDEIRPHELIGARLEVRVSHEEWEGSVRLRVREYRAAKAGDGHGR